MKNIRKSISVILVALIVLSSFAFAVSAEDCNHLYSATNVAPTCAENGYTLYACPLCGDNYKDYKNGLPALGHNYGQWYSVDEATCENEGHDKRECLRCGAADIKTIAVVDHIDVNSNGECDFCGEKMENELTVSPFDWLIALFNAIVQFFRDIFA